MAEVITVSALNRYVKSLFDANDRLFDLALRGEVANFVQNARSGHCYFTLRDEQASVKAVMFRSDARRLAFRPEEGMRVVVRRSMSGMAHSSCMSMRCSRTESVQHSWHWSSSRPGWNRRACLMRHTKSRCRNIPDVLGW